MSEVLREKDDRNVEWTVYKESALDGIHQEAKKLKDFANELKHPIGSEIRGIADFIVENIEDLRNYLGGEEGELHVDG